MSQFFRAAFLASVVLASVASQADASASVFRPIGIFRAPTTVAMPGLTRSQCEKGGGFMAEDLCMISDHNEVAVKRDAHPGRFIVSVTTIGTNGHSCMIDKQLFIKKGPRQLATLLAEDALKKLSCEVVLTYRDSNTVSVSDNGNCADFCGANAWLSFDHAKRVK